MFIYDPSVVLTGVWPNIDIENMPAKNGIPKMRNPTSLRGANTADDFLIFSPFNKVLYILSMIIPRTRKITSTI